MKLLLHCPFPSFSSSPILFWLLPVVTCLLCSARQRLTTCMLSLLTTWNQMSVSHKPTDGIKFGDIPMVNRATKIKVHLVFLIAYFDPFHFLFLLARHKIVKPVLCLVRASLGLLDSSHINIWIRLSVSLPVCCFLLSVSSSSVFLFLAAFFLLVVHLLWVAVFLLGIMLSSWVTVPVFFIFLFCFPVSGLFLCCNVCSAAFLFCHLFSSFLFLSRLYFLFSSFALADDYPDECGI